MVCSTRPSYYDYESDKIFKYIKIEIFIKYTTLAIKLPVYS